MRQKDCSVFFTFQNFLSTARRHVFTKFHPVSWIKDNVLPCGQNGDRHDLCQLPAAQIWTGCRPIHITISFPYYSSNKSFNCYHERSLNMMWYLTTAIISNCKARPLPFTLSLYQCPTWWWLSRQLKHVVVLNRQNIQYLLSVLWIIKTNIW